MVAAVIIGADVVTRSRRVHSGLADEMIQQAAEQLLPRRCRRAPHIVIVRFAPQSLWMLPGLWQIVLSLGVFAACRMLPAPLFVVGVWYLVTGLACVAFASGAQALSPWAMGLPSASGNCSPPSSFVSPDRAMPKTKPKSGDSGRFAYEGLDRVIHEKARLGVLTSLVAHPKGLLFGDLKQLCDMTDGNLSRHLQVLEEAGLIEIEKFESNRPQTTCRITAEGRKRYMRYLAVLEQVVRDAADAAKGEFAPIGGRRIAPAWR